MRNVKDLVQGTTARFKFYRDGQLWYDIEGTDFTFPVPISDIGNATFNYHEKGMLMMRYVRKQLEFLEKNLQG